MKRARFGFPKSLRLRKRADFLRLSRDGKKVSQPHFLLIYNTSPDNTIRFGITVSRRIGCAVVRNRVKRIVREVCRHLDSIAVADYNIIARSGAQMLDYVTARTELEKAFRKVACVA